MKIKQFAIYLKAFVREWILGEETLLSILRKEKVRLMFTIMLVLSIWWNLIQAGRVTFMSDELTLVSNGYLELSNNMDTLKKQQKCP